MLPRRHVCDNLQLPRGRKRTAYGTGVPVALVFLLAWLVHGAEPRPVGAPELGVTLQAPASLALVPVPPPHSAFGAVLELEETVPSADGLLVTVLCLLTDSNGRPPVPVSAIPELYQMMGGETARVAPLSTRETVLAGRKVRCTTGQAGATGSRLDYVALAESAFLFAFVFDYADAQEARVRPVIDAVLASARLDAAARAKHLLAEAARETDVYVLSDTPIPYPGAWRAYGKGEFDDLLADEVSDHYYSQLVMGRDADVVLKAPLENEQLFSYAVEQWHMRMDLSRLEKWGRRRLARKCNELYGSGYQDRSPGMLSERACAFRFDVRKSDTALVIYDVLVRPTSGNILYVRIRAHPTLFDELLPLFERYIVAMSS